MNSQSQEECLARNRYLVKICKESNIKNIHYFLIGRSELVLFNYCAELKLYALEPAAYLSAITILLL